MDDIGISLACEQKVVWYLRSAKYDPWVLGKVLVVPHNFKELQQAQFFCLGRQLSKEEIMSIIMYVSGTGIAVQMVIIIKYAIT